MARYFKNPPKRGKRKSKKRRTAKQIAATRKLVAMNKAKKRGKKRKVVRRKKRAVASVKRRKVRRTIKRRTPKMAKRRRAVGKRRRSSGRKRSGNITLRRVKGRVYSSNPPFLRGIMQGGKDAAAVLAGGAAARTISNLVPLAKTGFIGIGVQVGAAAVVGMAARRFVSGDIARMMVAGAMQVPLKALITQFIPGAAGLLGDYDMSSYLSGGQQALYSSDGASALPESGVYVGEDAEGMNAYVDAY